MYQTLKAITMVAFLCISWIAAQSQSFQVVGTLSDGAGSTMYAPGRVHVVGSYAYILATNSFVILNISDPNNPTKVSSLTHSSSGPFLQNASRIFVAGGYAYIGITGSSPGLEIVNVSTVSSPTHAGFIPHNASGPVLQTIKDIKMVGSYLYLLADFQTGVFSTTGTALEIMSLTNPASPVHSGKITNTEAALLKGGSSLFVTGGLAYVASTTSNALEIIDVGTNPASPTHKGSIANGSGGAVLAAVTSVSVSGTRAFLVGGGVSAPTLEVVDVTSPSSPVHLGSKAISASPGSISINGNIAYVIATNQLQVIDVTNPAAMAISSSSAVNGVTAFFVSGSYAYLTFSSAAKMQIWDVASPVSPMAKGTYFNDGPALLTPLSVATSGNYAYVCASEAVEVANVSNPSAPAHATKLMTGAGSLFGNPMFVTISGNYAYLASNGSVGYLEIIDIANPLLPQHKSKVETLDNLNDAAVAVFVSGSYAYLLSKKSLRIINISAPSSPVQTGKIINGGGGGAVINNGTSLFVLDNYAYITNSAGSLEIINVSDKANPSHAGIISNGGSTLLSAPQSVIVIGNDAFVASSLNNAIEIVDVTTKTAPTHKASIIHSASGPQLSSVANLAVQGNYLYATGSPYLSVFDITNPSAPTYISSTGTPGDLAVAGKFVYVVNPNSLKILTTSTSITGFSPTAGVVGTTVTITGQNFDAVIANNVVKFNNVPATVTASTATTMTTTVPSGATTGKVTVTANGALATSATNFSVKPVVRITSLATGTYRGTINLTVDKGGSTGAVSYSVVNGTGTASLSGSTLTLTQAGTVTVRADVAADANYGANYAEQIVTIDKAPLTATATSASRAYGQMNILGVTYTGLLNGEPPTSLDIQPTPQTSAVQDSDVGTYVIDLTIGTDLNYAITHKAGVLTVTKAPLSAKADDVTRIYGSATPALSITYTGFLNNDIVTDLDNKPVLQTSAGASSDAGTYPITLTTGSDNNYAITNQAGTLTITKANQVISLSVHSMCVGATLPFTAPTLYVSSGLAVSTALATTSAATLSGNTLQAVSPGSATVTLSNSGNINYNPVSKAETITIDYCFNPQSLGVLYHATGSSFHSPAGVHVVGSYAYVIAGNTLSVLDVSTATDPKLVGTLTNGTGGAVLAQPVKIYVLGAYAYIGTQSGGLEIVNVSNPASPVHAGFLAGIPPTGGARGIRDIMVAGSYAYLTTFVTTPGASNPFPTPPNPPTTTYALEIVNISSPASPALVGKLMEGSGGALLQGAAGVFVNGNYAYIASSISNALEVVDVSVKSSPVHFASLVHGTGGAILQGANAICVAANKAYVTSTGSNAIEIIDVSNPASPTHLGNKSVRTGPAAVFVNGNYAYVMSQALNQLGMEVIDVSNPQVPVQVSVRGFGSETPSSMFVAGNYAYITFGGGIDKLQIYDVSVSTSIVAKGIFFNNGPSLLSPTGLAVFGNYAYVAATDAFEVVDVSNPSAPQHAAKLMTGGALTGRPASVFLAGAYAYVVGSSTAGILEIVDISNPLIPARRGSYSTADATNDRANSVFVKDNYAYLLSPTYLRILDISNPNAPVLIGQTSAPGSGFSIQVSGTYAYVITSSNTFNVFDISNKANPLLVATLTNGAGGAMLNSPRSIQILGNHAFIASAGSNAIEVIDITNPAAPTHKASIVNGTDGAQLASVYWLDIQGNFLYASNSTQLSIFDITNPGVPVLLASSANGGPLDVQNNFIYQISQHYLKVIQVPPIVSSFTPASGRAGTSVTITGSNFDALTANNIVYFNYVPATVIASTLTSITAIVPAGATSGPITVRVGTLAMNSKTNFLVVPEVTITSASSGPSNTTINLTTDKGGSTGAVTYTVVNGTGTASVSGSVLTLTATGTVTVTATVAADANYASGTAQQTVTIIKASQTIDFPQPPNKTVGDAPFALSATASSGLGVSYTSSNTEVATISGNTVTVLCTGTTTFTASQTGDANYNAAISVQKTITVFKGSQTVTFSQLAAKTYGDPAFTVNASASSGLPVTFFSSANSIATVTGNTIQIVGAGNVSITARQLGNSCYNAAETIQPLTINKAVLRVECVNATKSYGDANPSFSFNYAGFVNGESGGIDTAPTIYSSASSCSPVGSYTITGTGASDDKYSFTYVNAVLTVGKRTITATPLNASRPYLAQNPAFQISYATVCNDNSITTPPTPYTAATQSSDAGAYPITLSGGSDDQYNFSLVTGTLTISKLNQTIDFPLPTTKCGLGTFSLTASSSAGLPVTFSSGTPSAVSITGTTANALTYGSVMLTASNAGNVNYNSGSQSSVIEIKDNTTATLTASPSTDICSKGYADLYAGPAISSYTWSTGEVTVNNSIRAYDPGTFTVTYTQSGNCVVSKSIVITRNGTGCIYARENTHVNMGGANASEQNSSDVEAMVVYPNPAAEQITIAMPIMMSEDTHVLLIDNFGKVSKKSVMLKDQWKVVVSISDVVNGFYLVAVGEGVNRTYRKLLIMH
jgi:hypothetical protein